MFLTLVLNQQDTRLTQWLNHLLAFSLFSDALGQHRREREKKKNNKREQMRCSLLFCSYCFLSFSFHVKVLN